MSSEDDGSSGASGSGTSGSGSGAPVSGGGSRHGEGVSRDVDFWLIDPDELDREARKADELEQIAKRMKAARAEMMSAQGPPPIRRTYPTDAQVRGMAGLPRGGREARMGGAGGPSDLRTAKLRAQAAKRTARGVGAPAPTPYGAPETGTQGGAQEPALPQGAGVPADLTAQGRLRAAARAAGAYDVSTDPLDEAAELLDLETDQEREVLLEVLEQRQREIEEEEALARAARHKADWTFSAPYVNPYAQLPGAGVTEPPKRRGGQSFRGQQPQVMRGDIPMPAGGPPPIAPRAKPWEEADTAMMAGMRGQALSFGRQFLQNPTAAVTGAFLTSPVLGHIAFAVSAVMIAYNMLDGYLRKYFGPGGPGDRRKEILDQARHLPVIGPWLRYRSGEVYFSVESTVAQLNPAWSYTENLRDGDMRYRQLHQGALV